MRQHEHLRLFPVKDREILKYIKCSDFVVLWGPDLNYYVLIYNFYVIQNDGLCLKFLDVQ
jgi:hypothetical protein